MVKIETDLKELISIEHKFLRYASSITSNPICTFFDHDYTQIRSLFKIESLRSIIKKTDNVVAYKIANKLYSSEEVNNLFVRRSLQHNLRNINELKNEKIKPNFIGNSTSFRLRDLWNKLPPQVKTLDELYVFKKSIRNLV